MLNIFLGSGFELTVNPKSDKGNIMSQILPHINNTVPNAMKLPKRHNSDNSARFMLPLIKSNPDSSNQTENELNQLEVRSWY